MEKQQITLEKYRKHLKTFDDLNKNDIDGIIDKISKHRGNK